MKYLGIHKSIYSNGLVCKDLRIFPFRIHWHEGFMPEFYPQYHQFKRLRSVSFFRWCLPFFKYYPI